MKKILLILVLFLANLGNNYAQTNKQATLKLYYEPNAYQLTAVNEKQLNELLAQLQDFENLEFTLHAFTDDLGGAAENEKLADLRAEEIRTYLLEKGIENSKIFHLENSLYRLDNKQDIAAQRKENRRVELEVFKNTSIQKDVANKTEEALSKPSFFENERLKASQYFMFKSSLGSTIVGEKGTYLSVPTDAFVDESGNLYTGTVTFVLQEAYSKGDLILQNLATTSGDKILETGGSFLIAAKDEKGNSLQLAKGKAIKASMPSEGALQKNMQVFYGGHDPLGNVEWKPSNKLVDNEENNNSYKQEVDKVIIAKTISTLNFNSKIADLSFSSKMPTHLVKKFFDLKAPQEPVIRWSYKPKMKDVLSMHQQGLQESDAAFRIRSAKILEEEIMRYEQDIQATKNYKKRSAQYVVELEKYQKHQAEHAAYCKQMVEILKEMYSITSLVEKDILQNHFLNMSVVCASAGSTQANILKAKNNASIQVDDYLQKGLSFEQIKDQINQFEVPVIKEADIKELKSQANWYRKIANSSFGNKQKPEITKNICSSVSEKYIKFKEAEYICNEDLLEIRALYSKMKSTLNINNIMKVKDFILNELDSSVALNQLKENCKNITNLNKAILEQRKKLGLLVPNEYVNTYKNSMELNKMGWINCDRFYNDNGPRVSILVITEVKDNTDFFLVFEDINSIIKLTPTAGIGYSTHFIPAGRRVKIMGIRRIGSEVEISVEDNFASRLTRVFPVFEEISNQEFYGDMAKL